MQILFADTTFNGDEKLRRYLLIEGLICHFMVRDIGSIFLKPLIPTLRKQLISIVSS